MQAICCRNAVALLLATLLSGQAAAQDNVRDRSREAPPRERAPQQNPQREPEAQPGRGGGIPRSMVAPDGGNREREGTEDGLPEMKAQPRVQPGGVAPYWVPPANDWKLGVYAYNTESGVVITRVVPRSAAARSGLEAGDKIVNISGFQVGFVGDQLYPLGHELQRHAGPSGRVGLLVQNVRNRELLTLDVALDRR